MGDNVGPSPKRRRGPPRKAAPKDTISAGDVGDVFEDELALEYPKEKVRTMPKKGLLLGHDSARRGRPAARNREEPPWNWELEEAGPAPSRLRGKASAVLADKDKYEPLRLYENSSTHTFRNPCKPEFH